MLTINPGCPTAESAPYMRPPIEGLPAAKMVAIAPGIFVNEVLLAKLRLVPMRPEQAVAR